MRAGVCLLLRWVRATEWRWFLDFATPAFFDVMPLDALSGPVRGLVRAAADADGFRRARADVERTLTARGIGVRIVAEDAAAWRAAADPVTADTETRRRFDPCALGSYFGQLFAGETSRLDLRAGRLRAGPLGIALACLDDGLEALGVVLGVRDAFDRASG